jgi:hypothetical protein
LRGVAGYLLLTKKKNSNESFRMGLFKLSLGRSLPLQNVNNVVTQ